VGEQSSREPHFGNCAFSAPDDHGSIVNQSRALSSKSISHRIIWTIWFFHMEGMESNEQPSVSSESRQSHRQERFTSHEKTDAVLRLLKGESIETVSQELGVTVRRIERWKSSFVAAGSAELARRKDGSSKSWAEKHSLSIRQWIWLLCALVAVISILVVLMQRSPQE
jgi:hypothetical protein